MLKDLARRQKQVHVLPEDRAAKIIKKYNLPEDCANEIIAALREAYQRGHDCDVVRFKSASYIETRLEEPPV